MYSRQESLLVNAANKQDYEEDLKFVTKFDKKDLCKEQLEMQLDILATSRPPETSRYDLPFLLKQLKAMSIAQRSLLCHVCTVISLILVMPATNAVSERSFSTLRRIKTYLRSTMSQIRLNSNIITLHIHKDLTDNLDLLEVGNEFVSAFEHRQNTLGKFLSTNHWFLYSVVYNLHYLHIFLTVVYLICASLVMHVGIRAYILHVVPSVICGCEGCGLKISHALTP